MASLEFGVPMQPEMVFRIGSISKQFTAAAILLLSERGKLALTDDIRKYLPNYPTHGASITIEHLLTHTSGIKSFAELPSFTPEPATDISPAQVLEQFKNLPLQFQPGTQSHFSESGYLLLGVIIEKVSGEPYEKFLDQNIFQPLGMTHTGISRRDRFVAGRVVGYTQKGLEFVEAPYVSVMPYLASKALESSADDLAIWASAMDDGKLLRKESWQRMFTAYRLKDGSSSGYGYGWLTGEFAGQALATHDGKMNGFTDTIFRLPGERLTVIILTNQNPEAFPVGPTAFRLAAAMLNLNKQFEDPPVAHVAPSAIGSVAGIYEIPQGQRVTVRAASDHLVVQWYGSPPRNAYPETGRTFFLKNTLVRFIFGDGELTFQYSDGYIDHAKRIAPAEPVQFPDRRTCDRYVGVYVVDPGVIVKMNRRGDHLFITALGTTHELWPASQTDFFSDETGFEFRFNVDEAGTVRGVVLRQNGQDYIGHRQSK